MRTLLTSCIVLVGCVGLGLSTVLAEPTKESATAGKSPATGTPQEDLVLSRLPEGDRAELAELEAELSKARMDFEIAKLAKQEYVEGTYVLEKQTLELEIFLTMERARRAEREVARTKQLAKGGEAAARDVEDNEFELNEAQSRSQIAKTKLHVLEKCTKTRTVAQLDRDILVADTHLTNLGYRYRLFREQLELQARAAKPAAEKAPPAAKGRD